MGRRGRKCKQLLGHPKEKSVSWKLKEEALDHALWRTRSGRGNWPVVKQTKEWMDETLISLPTSNSASSIGRWIYSCVSPGTASVEDSFVPVKNAFFYLASYRPTSQCSVLWEYGIWNVCSTTRFLQLVYYKYKVAVYILSIQLFLPLLTRIFHCITSQLCLPSFA